MTDTIQHCSACGRVLKNTRLRGLCPACLARGVSSVRDAPQEEIPATEETDDALFHLPGHDVLEEIARGGMGIVYRARQHHPAREVALKMLLPGGATPALRERFRNEARTMSDLEHKGVLPLHQFGEHGGTPWFTMKLASGGSLADRLKSGAGQRFSPRDAATLMAEIADAIAYAHQRGVLHRDLKPGNILFDAKGHPYVADFGLAKLDSASAGGLTHSRAMLGTPHYLAPELARKAGTTATVATDIYALGAILYELLAGRPPFLAETLAALLRSIVDDDPPSLLSRSSTQPDMIPRGLAAIAGKAMAKDPDRRYRDAAAFAADLRAWLAGEAIEARPPGALEMLARWLRKHPALAASLTLLAVGAAAVIILQAKSGRELRRERDTAESARGDALAREAAAARASGRPDLRDAGIAAARAAAAFKVTPELRDDAITLLAMPAFAPRDAMEAGKCEIVPLAPDHDVLVKRDDKRIILQPLLDPSQPAHASPELPQRIATVIYIAPEAKLVAVRCHDSTHHLYDRTRDKWIRSWQDPCWGFVVSRDGQLLAWGRQGSGNGVIENLLTGEIKLEFTVPRRQAVPRAFSPDGRLLAVGGFMPEPKRRDDGIAIVDTATGEVRHHLECNLFEKQIPDVVWRPDSRAVAVNQGTSDFYCHTFDGPLVRERIIGHLSEGESLSWHPDGRWLATAGFDGTLRIWEMPSRREVLHLPYLFEHIQFSRDGTELAGLAEGRTLHRFSFTVPACVRQMPLPRNASDSNRQRPSWGCALSPDGRLGITASNAGLHWFDAVSGTRLGWQGIGYALGMTFNDAGDTVYTTSSSGLWRIPVKRTGLAGYEAVLAANIRQPQLRDYALRVCLSEAASRLVYTSNEGGVSWMELPDMTPHPLPTPFPVNPCVISPDGRWIVASGGDDAAEDCGLLVYDMEKPEAQPRLLTGYSRYTYTCFSPDGTRLYAYSRGFQTALATGTWQRLWTYDRSGESDNQHLLALSGDGSLLAAVDSGGVIGLFDPRNGTRLASLRHPVSSWIGWMAFDRTGARLIATTLPDSIVIWDLRELRRELGELGLDWNLLPYPPAPRHGKFTLRFVPEVLAK